MNNKLYNFVTICLVFLLTYSVQAQKKYQKTFPVNTQTKLSFQTHNVDVTFKVWNKNEVKIDFTIDYKNYSAKEIKEMNDGILLRSNVQDQMDGSNLLEIQTSSQSSIKQLSYQLRDDNYIALTNIGGSSKEKNRYRSVSDIHKEIDTKSLGFKEMDGFIVTKTDSIPLAHIDKSSNKNILSVRSSYTVYVPNYIYMRVMATSADVSFEGIFTNQIEAAFLESSVRADALKHEKNDISLTNGKLKVKTIQGGHYAFKNVTNTLIGTLQNVAIVTEFSKISIGEITSRASFRDFKSDFFIYNLGDDFESIVMNCEYSDITLFTDNDQKYYLEAMGNNAVLTDKGRKIIVQPSRDGKKTKIFTKGKPTAPYLKNTFKIDLVHGFVTLFDTK